METRLFQAVYEQEFARAHSDRLGIIRRNLAKILATAGTVNGRA
jgi:hypothetical protein